MDCIGKSLEEFENSKQLMQVVSDAFTACQQAYERCEHRIHRDISGRNILIDENGRGILIDWDLSKREADLHRLRRHERTGTWQFMSYLLVSRDHFIHTIQDDMESFIHIMLYFALRYLKHSSGRWNVPTILSNIFDNEGYDLDGHLVGGAGKRPLFMDKFCLGHNFKFSSAPLQSWWQWALIAARQWIQYSYDSVHGSSEGIPFPDQDTEPVEVTNLQLCDHSKMAWMFKMCLASRNWPENEPRPVDAAPEAGGMTKSSFVSSNRLESEHANEDGAIGGSGKQSQNSRGRGSRGGSGLQHPKKQSTPTHSMATRAGSKSNQG
ncbi:hypothetical protein C0995_012354 [Termitomyces sp. Mi166|nr:hypothetical protein C0995_012354 [Termitomyces sp. Mi166\